MRTRITHWETPKHEPMEMYSPARNDDEPTAGEKAVVIFALTAASWMGVYLIGHIIWALLNTKEFLFNH